MKSSKQISFIQIPVPYLLQQPLKNSSSTPELLLWTTPGSGPARGLSGPAGGEGGSLLGSPLGPFRLSEDGTWPIGPSSGTQRKAEGRTSSPSRGGF